MEGKPNIKKCEICMLDATCLCFQCMSYFCDSCFKSAHGHENRKAHKKEKIDYFVPIDTKCPEHPDVALNLFCLEEKGNYIYILLKFRTLLLNVLLYEST